MKERPVLDVTVVLLDGGLSSTAIMPVEIFHSAGTLWNDLHGQAPQPAFRVRTVSLTGDAVRSPYGLSITPETALDEIEQTDIIIVPTSGLDLDLKLVENSALLPWLKRHYENGAYVAGSAWARPIWRRPACWTVGSPPPIGRSPTG